MGRKADESKYSVEEAAALTLDDIKKMIEVEIPGAFSKKEKKAKAPAKKKAAPKKNSKKR